MLYRYALTCLLLMALLPVTNAAARDNDDPFREDRAAFQAAYASAALPGTPARESDSDSMRTYPLYPYLQAARLRQALSNASGSLESVDERADKFLTYYDREPVARELRRAWLTSLADRGQWETYLKHYRDTADDSLQCRSFVARIELGKTENLSRDIAKQWLTPQSLPDCEQPFEWLRAQNALTPELIEQRARMALAKNNPSFARQMAALLPADRAAPLLQWAGLLDNPRRGIDALIAAPGTAVEPKALLDGWTQLARKDRAAAAARYDALVKSRRFDAKSASPYALALALALSWDRDPEALEYFQLVDAADFDDSAREWHTRAALWSQDWALVSRSISAMSSETRQTARWRYWAARAAEQSRDLPLARQLYTSTLADDNYYSAMSAARLDQPIQPHPEKLVVDRTQLREIEQLPAMVRARELLLSNLRSQAYAEWQYGYETLSENARTQAIHLAAEWGWYDQAVATATQRLIFNDYALLYPRPYDAHVHAGAKLAQLRPELIYGVLRQESLYRSDASSSAGARGLLQLLPETARRTAQTWGRPRPAADDLYDPAVNILLGAAQLRSLIDKFNGQTAVALAAYNAGPNAAKRWLPTQAMEVDIWVENIPFNETRGYVQRVLWHSVVFAWLHSGEPQRTESWLVRIAPPTEPTVVGTL